MKKTQSLRRTLSVLMAFVVLFQSLAFVLSISLSQVYPMLDAEAFRLLNSTTASRKQELDQSIDRLTKTVEIASRELSSELMDLARAYGIQSQVIYRDDDAYAEAARQFAELVMTLIRNNDITGAYVRLNGSKLNQGEWTTHSAVYMRSTEPKPTLLLGSDFSLEIGPKDVALHYRIPVGSRWKQELQFDPALPSDGNLYWKPVWAAARYSGTVPGRYGYWMEPYDVLGDGKKVVSYSVPLLDNEGKSFGVIGIELSAAYMARGYLPKPELTYPDSFYALTNREKDTLELDWYIPGSFLAQMYLQQGQVVTLEPVGESTTLYKTRLEGMGDMYCTVLPVTMYSQNQPFTDRQWIMINFVPQSSIHENSQSVRESLVITIILTAVVAFSAVFLVSFLFTRRISRLSEYVNHLLPHDDIHFERTGLGEIDDLSAAVERLNQSVINAGKTTSKILDLTLLPVGGFEILKDGKHVILTKMVYELLQLESGVPVTVELWKTYYGQLTREPLSDEENTYQYQDKTTGTHRFLRILETETPAGVVGAIVDVTKEVQERRRLARELDYDGLTRLYNRRAFKREVTWRIMEDPDQIGVMIFCDLDNLKYINDNFGHDMGDRLIIRAGELFREFSFQGGVVARISGDEFATYLHGFNSQGEARRVVENQFRHNEAFRINMPNGAYMWPRFSAGMAWYPADADNVPDLLRLADFAMYEAKHWDKGSVREFDQESYQRTNYLLENRETINRLLDDCLIRFAFQPIVSLVTGEIYGYEALMRPMLENFKSPGEVLAVAASQSKLVQLERLVMFMGYQTLRDQVSILKGRKLFLNSIPSQILRDEDHLLLEEMYSDLFSHVVVELTEAENNTPQLLADKSSYLRKHNVLVALDDYGSGYSNEIRILGIRPDIVKVDMELVRGIHQSRDKQVLVSNLVKFCHEKGILVIAEGVEQAEELAELARLEMDYVQGYYLARPSFTFDEIPKEAKEEILGLNRQYRGIDEKGEVGASR